MIDKHFYSIRQQTVHDLRAFCSFFYGIQDMIFLILFDKVRKGKNLK